MKKIIMISVNALVAAYCFRLLSHIKVPFWLLVFRVAIRFTTTRGNVLFTPLNLSGIIWSDIPVTQRPLDLLSDKYFVVRCP